MTITKNDKLAMVFMGILFLALLFTGWANAEEEIIAQQLDATEWTVIGEFDFEGLNATPMKEVAIDGYEFIEVKAEYSAKDEIYFLTEIYYEDKDFRWPIACLNLASKEGEMIVRAPISPSKRFQILTQAFMLDGSYDKDYTVDRVKLSYRITN